MTRADVGSKICQRVRGYWEKGTEIAGEKALLKFHFEIEQKTYLLNSRTKKLLIAQCSTGSAVDLAFCNALVQLCVPEFIRLLGAVAANDNAAITASMLDSTWIKALAKQTGQENQLTGELFDCYLFYLSLFWVYNRADSTCTCRPFKHYRCCKHYIAMLLQTGKKPPDIFNFKKAKVVNRNRKRKTNAAFDLLI